VRGEALCPWSHTAAGKTKHGPYNSRGQVKLSFAPGLFWILLLCLFLSDFNLNPVFVINCTHDNNGFQSSMSPSGETLSLGLSCQNLTQPDFPTRAPVEFGFSVSPKAHVLKAWSPGWCYWEVVKSLGDQ
jgi:hypothetical protein